MSSGVRSRVGSGGAVSEVKLVRAHRRHMPLRAGCDIRSDVIFIYFFHAVLNLRSPNRILVLMLGYLVALCKFFKFAIYVYTPFSIFPVIPTK